MNVQRSVGSWLVCTHSETLLRNVQKDVNVLDVGALPGCFLSKTFAQFLEQILSIVLSSNVDALVELDNCFFCHYVTS